jgi:hypothetical protein
MEKGKIELPWDDFFPPAQRAGSRNFNWGERGWRALPKIFFHLRDGLAADTLLRRPGLEGLHRGYGCFELKILAVSTAAPSLGTHRRGHLSPYKY